MASSVVATVDLDRTGRQVGHLVVPWSRDESGWGNLLTPIAVINGGPGPTALLTGGNHGDEFEGPVALRRLVTSLRPEQVRGRVIVVPGLNQAALAVGRRHSPIDGANLNRSFPGDPTGTVSRRLAHYVTTELVERADLVLDLHSGGTSMVFVPFVATHDLPDREQLARTLPYLRSFGTPFAAVIKEPDPRGMLDNVVEERGKVFVTTEIGGGRTLTARTVDLAHRGVLNTLRQAGLLEGEPEHTGDPRFVRMVDDGTVLAPAAGLFEPHVDPGDEAAEGEAVATIHPLDDLAAPPRLLTAPLTGVVVMRHAPGLVAAGDPVASLALDAPAPW